MSCWRKDTTGAASMMWENVQENNKPNDSNPQRINRTLGASLISVPGCMQYGTVKHFLPVSKIVHKPSCSVNWYLLIICIHTGMGVDCRIFPSPLTHKQKLLNYRYTGMSIARRPIRTNCTTGVRTYFCKSTECPESRSSIAGAIAQVGFLSRRRQSKLCTSSSHFLVIRSRIYGYQVAMIPLRSWRFFVVPQTRFFLLAFSTTLH